MKTTFYGLLVPCLLVAACGGGSGGNGGLGNPPSAALNITSGNALNAAKVSYEAALASTSVNGLSGETGLIAGGPAGASKLGGVVVAANKSSSGLSLDPIPPTTTPCDVAGSVTISGDIADPFTPTLSPNDFFDIEFDMCDDGLGAVTDGDVNFVVDAFTGDFLGGLYDLTMTMTLTNLQIATANDVLTSNGDVSATLDTTAAPEVASTVSGNSLTVDTNASSESLTNFATMQTLDAGVSPAPYTLTSSGTLDTSQLAGSVQYSTPVTFQGFGTDYPSSGEFLVVGNNSSALLIVLDNVNVQIQVDTDGDGNIDNTIDTTWAELTS